MTLPPQRKRWRYCIAHNPLLLQPLGHWFTFIFRAREHRAVWVTEERSYWLTWALPFGIAFPSPHLYCTTNFSVCQYLFEKIFGAMAGVEPAFPNGEHFPRGRPFCISSILTGIEPLLSHRHDYCITNLAACQYLFEKIFAGSRI